MSWGSVLRPQEDARRLVPEVVESSVMDCGPAALKCLAEGFLVPVSYDRLREACQTDVDGTSIDDLEDVACYLGLNADQVMLPPDWVLVPEARALPAILVVRSPIGATHFVVVWNRHGSWVQLMDPAVGRRWMKVDRLLAETHVHSVTVSSQAWREWAASAEFTAVLRARLQKLRLPGNAVARLLDEAQSDRGWRSLAALDAAVRMTDALIRANGLRAGSEAEALLQESVREAVTHGSTQSAIPERYWSVRQPTGMTDRGTEGGEDPQDLLEMRGAVLIRVRGRRTHLPQSEEPGAEPRRSQELAAAVERPTNRPLRSILRMAFEEGPLVPAAIGAGLVAAAALTVLEALIFRGFLDLALKLALPHQRLVAAAALAAFLLLLLLLEIPVFQGTLRVGRRLETLLRRKFLVSTAGQPDRYFRSRLSSDLAERCHSVHKLHDAPELAGRVLRTLAQVLFVAVGISLLHPESTPIAFAAAGLAVGLPLAAQPLLGERDLRVRDHAGALARFYLDALLGIVPLRSHSGERAVRREHEGLLTEWVRGAYRFERAALHLDWLTAGVGYGFTAWLVFRYVGGGGEPTGILLLTYWALLLPNLGMELSVAARQIPLQRSTARRLLEPLSAEGEDEIEEGPRLPEPARTPEGPGVSIELSGVRIVAAGRTILDGIDLEVSAGSKVAIVGASGAGKSSLVSLLLGWHQASAGRVFVDGRELDGEALAVLRNETAWIDPSVQIWNRSLLANLLYGAPTGAEAAIGPVVRQAELSAVIEGLPDGMATPLGEGGGLLSGGEGQRSRFGRALLRSDARLVILDEAFRGLDLGLRRLLLRRARHWWQGATLLCVTHDLAETLDFDRVVVLEGGRIIELGEPRELSSRPGSRYSQLLSAEEDALATLRSPADWRLLRLERGRVIEEREGPPAD